MMRHPPKNLALLLLVASGLFACGDDDNPTAATTPGTPGGAAGSSLAGASGVAGTGGSGGSGGSAGGGGLSGASGQGGTAAGNAGKGGEGGQGGEGGDTGAAGEEAGGEAGTAGTAGAAGAPAKKIVVDIVVDANRDGVINPEDAADQDNENEWTAKMGASFLANLDDDDEDGVRDVDDEIVNGLNDEADLARILLRANPDAPDGATGTFTIDELSAKSVRIWKKSPEGEWLPFAGSVGACTTASNCETVVEAQLTTDEVRSGLELAIEGRSFRLSLTEGTWTGDVPMTLTLRDADGNPLATDDNPDATDQAKLRVAPWVLFGNLDTFDHVWSDSVYSPLVKGVKASATAAGLTHTTHKKWNDRWTQDFFQTGWAAIPAADGAVHGMRLGNARPWGRENGEEFLPYTWLTDNYLKPDQGIFKVYKKANTGDTFDSHGNHDLLPPYTKGDESFPLGRIIIGSAVLKETKEFYNAQQVQGPYLTVKTSWLIVGHVDEVFSYVPAQTERGWKLLVASNTLSRTMLQKLETDGQGDVLMFTGKKAYNEKDQIVNAQLSVSEALKREDIMQWSQEAQVEIDDMLDVVKTAVGLTDDEIIEIPTLNEEVGGGKVAWQPGTANALVMGNHIAMADPFGPRVEDKDVFQKDLEDRLASPMHKLGSDGQGLVVHFVDDWTGYHINLGEVHCATNPAGPPPAKPWWMVEVK